MNVLQATKFKGFNSSLFREDNAKLMKKSTAFIFGSFMLDSSAGLFRHDRLVPLPPKELALLLLLLEAQGRVVSHKEIEEEVWPNQIVAYASLARCVYSLRKLLGADGKSYVETVPKRGYRLAVAVKKFEPSQTKSALSECISTLPLAYSHYAAGDREANDPSPAGQARAVLLFQEAARVDPNFAAAHAAVADTRMYQLVRGDLVPAEGLKLGLEACRCALEANPKLVQGLSILAWFKGAMLGELDEAHILLNEALAIDPGYSRAYVYRSWIFRNQGLARDSTVAAQRAAEINPHALLNRHSYSWALFCNDRVAEALAHEVTLQRMYPLDDAAPAYAGIFAAYLGRYREALAAIEAAIHISAGRPAVCAGAAYVFARAGKIERALQLAEAAAAAILPRAPRPILAPAYAELGDVDRALELLSEARDEGCVWFGPARLDPRLASLKSDDRFLALFS